MNELRGKIDVNNIQMICRDKNFGILKVGENRFLMYKFSDFIANTSVSVQVFEFDTTELEIADIAPNDYPALFEQYGVPLPVSDFSYIAEILIKNNNFEGEGSDSFALDDDDCDSINIGLIASFRQSRADEFFDHLCENQFQEFIGYFEEMDEIDRSFLRGIIQENNLSALFLENKLLFEGVPVHEASGILPFIGDLYNCQICIIEEMRR